MRIVAQRVSSASVTAGDEVVGQIDGGLLLLVGVAHDDGEAEVRAAVDKISNLRIFPDEEGKMNRSVIDVGGQVLVVSQFTLLGDPRKGRRPSFVAAAAPDRADRLIKEMVSYFAELGIPTAEGRFGAAMSVELVNDGPVTMALEVLGGRVV